MSFHARDAAGDASTTVNRVHLYIENNGTAAYSNTKPVTNYYCIYDISGLHQGDRLKTAVCCFTKPL